MRIFLFLFVMLSFSANAAKFTNKTQWTCKIDSMYGNNSFLRSIKSNDHAWLILDAQMFIFCGEYTVYREFKPERDNPKDFKIKFENKKLIVTES